MEHVGVCHTYVLVSLISYLFAPVQTLLEHTLPLGTVIHVCFCIPVILLLEEHALPYCVQQYVLYFCNSFIGAYLTFMYSHMLLYTCNTFI